MKKIILLLALGIIALVIISGCVQQTGSGTSTKYVCPDGKIVTNSTQCKTDTNISTSLKECPLSECCEKREGFKDRNCDPGYSCIWNTHISPSKYACEKDYSLYVGGIFSMFGTRTNEDTKNAEYTVTSSDFFFNTDEQKWLIPINTTMKMAGNKSLKNLKHTFYCQTGAGEIYPNGGTYRGFKFDTAFFSCRNREGDPSFSFNVCTLNNIIKTYKPAELGYQTTANTIMTEGNGVNLDEWGDTTEFFVRLIREDFAEYPTQLNCYLNIENSNIREQLSIKLNIIK